jgi:hypothetical protein
MIILLFAIANPLPLQKFPYLWTVLNRPELGKNCQELIPDSLFWTV